MKPYEFHPEALDDAIEARAFLERQQPGLGSAFDQEVTAAIQLIRSHPLLYPVERGRVRRCLLKRFRYSILFADLPGRIWIAAVAHHKRRPDYWHHRRPTP